MGVSEAVAVSVSVSSCDAVGDIECSNERESVSLPEIVSVRVTERSRLNVRGDRELESDEVSEAESELLCEALKLIVSSGVSLCDFSSDCERDGVTVRDNVGEGESIVTLAMAVLDAVFDIEFEKVSSLVSERIELLVERETSCDCEIVMVDVGVDDSLHDDDLDALASVVDEGVNENDGDTVGVVVFVELRVAVCSSDDVRLGLRLAEGSVVPVELPLCVCSLLIDSNDRVRDQLDDGERDGVFESEEVKLGVEVSDIDGEKVTCCVKEGEKVLIVREVDPETDLEACALGLRDCDVDSENSSDVVLELEYVPVTLGVKDASLLMVSDGVLDVVGSSLFERLTSTNAL